MRIMTLTYFRHEWLTLNFLVPLLLPLLLLVLLMLRRWITINNGKKSDLSAPPLGSLPLWWTNRSSPFDGYAGAMDRTCVTRPCITASASRQAGTDTRTYHVSILYVYIYMYPSRKKTKYHVQNACMMSWRSIVILPHDRSRLHFYDPPLAPPTDRPQPHHSHFPIKPVTTAVQQYRRAIVCDTRYHPPGQMFEALRTTM